MGEMLQSALKRSMDHPIIRPVSAWTVWHTTLEWGTPVPTLWASREIAEKALRARGLWPLRHGWRLIRVRVEPQLSGDVEKVPKP